MSRPADPAARRTALALLLSGCLTLLVGALVALLLPSGGSGSAQATPVDVATPSAALAGTAAHGLHPWSAPLQVEAAAGRLVRVDGLDGSVTDGVWRSTAGLVPDTTYALVAVVEDAAGRSHELPLAARTSSPTSTVSAALSPGDDAVVGVGMPVVVRLDAPVRDPAARTALVERLRVESTPEVVGAWRWTTPTEVHWRPRDYWPAGTEVRVEADLQGLGLPDGTWGQGVRTSRFRIGEAVVSTVDVAAKTMTVTRDGEVLKVLRASMGRPEFPTPGGTHLVLEKQAERTMDSSTVGLPAGTAGAYLLDVQHAVRLTYSGTFTHSAPWSVADQGVRNVSHGCINLSPADAQWFFDLATRGDVVTVVGSSAGPRLSDPGSMDWNLTWEQWLQPA